MYNDIFIKSFGLNYDNYKQYMSKQRNTNLLIQLLKNV